MKQKEIQRILNKYRDVFEALENYDKTDLENQFKRSLEDVRLGRVRKVA